MPTSAQRTVLAVVLEVVRGPLIVMLVACGGLCMLNRALQALEADRIIGAVGETIAGLRGGLAPSFARR